MKKLFLFLIAAMIASVMNAKTTDSYKYIYEPGTIHIYEHQRRWTTIDGKFGGSATYLYSIMMVIDVQPKGKGHDITLVRLTSGNYDRNGPMYFYEEDGVLYEYYTAPKSSSAKLVPWIDMRAHKGDKLYWYDYGKKQKKYYYSVTDEQTIKVKGIDRRILGINDGTGNIYYWIEGIGASKANVILSLETGSQSPTSVYGSPAYLAKCYNGDNCIFGQEDFAIHTSIEDVSTENSDSTDTPIYDLMGRQVTNPQHGHLYIQNGKKILW